jgi:8-oxo-dGTP diphosphatase / 2-hydroxy-dATP diphosphatase
MEEKSYTLVFCRRHRQTENGDIKEILLGMKKRGFGVGKWNGFGGKIEEGESVEEAAIRELKEESNLVVQPADLKRRGYIVFNMKESNKLMRVHIFESWDFSGTECESEEMRPQWYTEETIPFDKTWPDDKYWMPLFLSGKSFLGRFDYEDDDTITDYSLTEQ